MRNLYRIPEAIRDLESQEVSNVEATIKKYKLEQTTLGVRSQIKDLEDKVERPNYDYSKLKKKDGKEGYSTGRAPPDIYSWRVVGTLAAARS